MRFRLSGHQINSVARVGALGLMLTVAASITGSGPSAAAKAGQQSQGLGHVHMETSCTAPVAANFDRGLVLLHNFWYPRALATFNQVLAADPECAIAYWGRR